MLAATYTQGGALAIQEIPLPEIDGDGMLLRVTRGLDLRDRREDRPQRPPQACGRASGSCWDTSLSGVIERMGPRVAGYRVGQRVGVAPNAGCGQCDACVRGQSNYCPQYTAFGIDRDGAHAAHVAIPERFITQGNVIPLPETVSDREASLLEPFSCVVNGIRVSRIELGDTVVIFGAGPIGLLHAMLSRIAGAGKVMMIDPQEDRLARAQTLGCDVVVSPAKEDVLDRVRHETDGRGADVVITACPVAEVQSQAVRMLAPFGRLCLFGGLPKGDGPVALDTNAIHYGNFIVTGSTGGSVQDYRIALRLVAGKRVDLTRIISDTFPLADLQKAYETALAGPAGKVVLTAE